VTRPITASLLNNSLACPHRVFLDCFGNPALRDPVSPFVQLLWDKGTIYEKEVIEGLGMPFVDLSGLSGDEKEAATRAAIDRGDTLIYSGRLSVDELFAEPDLLRREGAGNVAIDIKSGGGHEGGATWPRPPARLPKKVGNLSNQSSKSEEYCSDVKQQQLSRNSIER
jgi:uncharacterized protein